MEETEKAPKEINVIQIASLKGKIFPKDKQGVKTGGLSLISQKIKDIKQQSNISDLVLIGNSNFIHGTPEVYFTEGDAVIELMNTLDFSLLVIGHRELYFGKNVLINLSKKAKFPFVSANVVESDGSIPNFIKPYVVFPEMDLAIIGITTHMFADTNIAEDLQGLKLLPMDVALKKYVKELKEKNIKNIVLAGDLIFGGSKEVERNKNLFKVLDIEGIKSYFVRTREVKNTDVGVIDYKREGKEDKEILVCEGSGTMIGHYTASKGTAGYKLYRINSNTSKPDHTLTDTFVTLKKVINDTAGGIIGTSEVNIPHEFQKESALGNFVTDISRLHIKADICLLNSGNQRNGFKKGPVSRLDIYNILPWGGTLVETEVTGAQLVKLLEASCSFRLEKSFVNVSGMIFKYDSSREKGNRVIQESIKINGEDLDPGRIYSLGTGRYIFDGGDRYSEFKELKLPLKKISPMSIRELVVEYILKHKTISSKVENRIIDVNK
ncbi:MAG: 5'-nucleotidase C-terminal domain-containing protein [Thermodesulfobacteriota bacterium]